MKIYRSRVHGGAPIYFGDSAQDMLLTEVDELAPDRVFIVTDRTVETLHSESVRELLPYAVPSELIVFNEGEENKNLASLQHVAGDLMRSGITDRSLVLNLGGGGVLDLGSLAASLLGKGIRFAHLATTTNAIWQVMGDDRQAIHFAGGRNALGVHRPPVFSIADPVYLETEDPEQARESFVEFVQLALALGGDVYERAVNALSATDFFRVPHLVSTLEQCLEIKLETCETDTGRDRAAQARHYGASLAKSMQILAEGRLSARQALYYGMRMSAEIARERGEMDDAGYARHTRLLDLLDLDVRFPSNVKIDRFIYQMHGNNKTLTDDNMMVLLSEPGQWVSSDRETEPTGIAGYGSTGVEASISDRHVAEAFEKVRLRG